MVLSDWNRRPRGGRWSVWALDGALEPEQSDDGSVAPVGTLVNAVAHRLRESLIALDGTLFSGKAPEIWAATGLAERNPYTSDFIRSLAAAVALVEAGRAGGNILVVTADPGLGRALAAICARAGLDAAWCGPAAPRWRIVVRRLQNWVNLVRDGWRDSRAMRTHGLKPERVKGRAVWLMSWTGAGGFKAGDSPDRDRFLGSLPRLVRDAGLSLGSVGNPTVWIEGTDAIAAAVAASDGAVTLMPAFLSLGARLRAALRALRVSASVRRTLVIDGVDLSPLVARALAEEKVSGVAPRALLYYEFGRECAKRGLKPDVLLYTYENQPWEKQLIAGFRRYCRETVLVGVQHTVFASFYLSADPSHWQLDQNYFPDLVIASGTEYRERLLRCGVPSERVVMGGALRFPEIAAPPAVPRPVTGLCTVLASLPLQIDEAKELSSVAIQATARLGLRLVINVHPMFDAASRADIARTVSAIGAATFSDAPARDLLGDADLLLYNSSGTVFDATARGVPSVYVGPRAGLDLDKLPGGNPLACRGAEALCAVLIRLAADPAHLRAHAAVLRERLATAFAMPDDALVVETLRHYNNVSRNRDSGNSSSPRSS